MAIEQTSQEKQKEFLDKYYKLSEEYGISIVCIPYIKADGEISVRLGLSLKSVKKT